MSFAVAPLRRLNFDVVLQPDCNQALLQAQALEHLVMNHAAKMHPASARRIF
jgi:hypothetical protein